MSNIHNKERWHSYGCLLYFRGGHRRNLHEKGSHPSIGCTLLFGHGIHCSFWYCRRLKTYESWLSRCDGIAKWCHHIATLAPMEAHMATCTMVWHSKPTTGDGEPQTPPQQSPPSRGTPCHLQAELGDLDDHKLWQLVEDLTQEIVQCKLTAPPSNPLQMNGYTHQAVKSPRRMTRRSPFQEGEGGVHWGNPLQLQSNQLEEGFPLDHPHDCHALHQQDQT